MKRSLIVLGVSAVALCVPAGAAEAGGNPWGVDYHANCTGGFAVGQTLGGDPGATEFATMAQPPKTDGQRSDAGLYSSTNCS
jgi:hypothetical protein